MFHSSKIIYALLLTGAVICGCNQRDSIDIDDNVVETPERGNVVFRLLTNTSTTLSTRGVEDSYNHVQGTADEYKVNNARVYLFDTPTKLFVKSIMLTNLTRFGTDANGYIVYETEHVAVPRVPTTFSSLPTLTALSTKPQRLNFWPTSIAFRTSGVILRISQMAS